MAKTITIEFEGNTYTLEFTRRSVEVLERRGFKIGEIEEKPVTTFPVLFAGAFLAHHKFVKPEVIEKMLGKLKSKDELVGKLVEMYNEPLIEMMNEPEDSEGNLEWGTSW